MGEILYEGDSLEIMRTLPSESVDMIFADPPFNIGKKYGGKSITDKRSDYYEWCAAWIAEGFRLLKPTGTFYLMTIPRHVFRMGCEMEKHGVFINKIEWRNVSAFHNKRGFWSSTQPIVVFGKTDKFKFNKDAKLLNYVGEVIAQSPKVNFWIIGMTSLLSMLALLLMLKQS